ncbi:hypothetical protein K3X41_09915 [Aliiroseovarius crassostreae]|uniref:hypothetical protein n=1 Tax=Aliiroseovarius crassostreae TaxID=154981 RepID=UPI00220CA7E0|nr:hypothetical protein [Aliiroseovarius crassostreae]UWQ10235.1 hypothetical protein K3X41_09915 [Aliiroseovarius crassostreae]
MAKIEFRRKARDHFDAAKAVVNSEDEGQLRYAALRLRMALECLAYELLQSFGDDVSQETMKTWQPGKLIKELKEIDAGIDQDRTISYGVEKVPGEPAKEMRTLGTDARLGGGWINKNWNALGQILHEPTIEDHENGRLWDTQKIKQKLEKVATEVERILSANLWATNIRVTISVECECGFFMTRREETLAKEGQIVCAKCSQIYAAGKQEEEWRFTKLFHDFNCPACGNKNKFEAKELTHGSKFACKTCGAQVGLFKDWCVRVIPEEAG